MNIERERGVDNPRGQLGDVKVNQVARNWVKD